MSARRKKTIVSPRAGFTFIEMLIVVAIIGLLYSIGSISFRGLMPKYYLKSSARRLGTNIEQVRLASISRGVWMGIHYELDPAGDETCYYQIIPPPPDDFPDQPIDQRTLLPKEHLPPGVRFARILLGSSRVVDRGSVNVLFSPMGNAGSHVVVLEGEGGRQASVKLNAITGTIDFADHGNLSFQNFQE